MLTHFRMGQTISDPAWNILIQWLRLLTLQLSLWYIAAPYDATTETHHRLIYDL